jgi:hypothetical protein
MRDIVITAKKIKREALIVLGVLLAAELINLYAIAKFDTNWSELYSQVGYVFVVAMILYLLVAVIRLMVHLVWSIKNKAG